LSEEGHLRAVLNIESMRGWDQIIKTGKNHRTEHLIICIFHMTLMKARKMKCAGNVMPMGKC